MRIISRLEDQIRSLVKDINLDLLEFNMGVVKNRIRISLVICAPGRITNLNDCSLAHSTILQHLNKDDVGGEFSIEILSPGISRIFKSMNEFSSFIGLEIRYLLKDDPNWYQAHIESAKNEIITLKRNNEAIEYQKNDFHKVKLHSD